MTCWVTLNRELLDLLGLSVNANYFCSVIDMIFNSKWIKTSNGTKVQNSPLIARYCSLLAFLRDLPLRYTIFVRYVRYRGFL